MLDRPPDADVAAALWAAIERGHGHGMVPAHGVTTIFYLLEKARDAAFARQGVRRPRDTRSGWVPERAAAGHRSGCGAQLADAGIGGRPGGSWRRASRAFRDAQRVIVASHD